MTATGLAGGSTCGVEDHDAECLCDVAITTPVKIGHDITKVWHAPLLLQMHDHFGWPWDGPKLADFMEVLGYAYDTWRAHNESGRAQSDLLLAFLRSGESIVDAPEHLGLTWGQAIGILLGDTNHRSCLWRLDEFGWIGLEGLIRDRASQPTIQRFVVAKTGVTIGKPKIIELFEMYGVERREVRTLTPTLPETKARLFELIDSGLNVRNAVKQINDDGTFLIESTGYKLVKDRSRSIDTQQMGTVVPLYS